VRLAPALIEERFAMRPTVVGRLLVLPRSTTSVRRVSGLGATFSAALPARTVEVRRWLQNPTGGLAGIAFVPFTNGRGSGRADRTR